MKVEGDDQQQGKLSESWSLCTVQQVEDFKSLIKICPLWSSSIFLHTPIAIQMSLMVLQALAMDRHVGP
ncbi:NRT1/ PTR FAMILY 2.7 [Thalictrum thalictroides]|uniref:NRT1/ PTR FAMILY 2.7 n=1 Tax=Thalictrum thalictroides TaxID=46969 RepID=A0A7J6VIM0_THATH|nr:NRT1/ PTR FAMILY 2.7 [Thalictrum thalictroides]